MHIQIISFIYLLLPYSLITGPFLSDLSISVIALIFLYISIKQRLWHYYSNSFVYIFIIFYFLLILSSILSFYPIEGISVSLFYFRYLFFVLATVYVIKMNDKFYRYLFISLVLAIFIISADGYLQKLTGFNSLGWELDESITGLFGDKKVIGTYLARLLPISFALFLLNYGNKSKFYILFLIFLIFVEVLIFLSGDRSDFFLVSLSTIIILSLSNSNKLFRLIAFFISTVIVLLIMNFNPTIKESIIDKTVAEFNGKTYSYESEKKDFEKKNTYLFTKYHDAYIFTSWKMFKEKPFLGHGPRSFRIVCNDEYYSKNNICSTHPHNIYLELFAETGIFGAIILIATFFYLLYIFTVQFCYLILYRKKIYQYDYEICLYSACFINIFFFIPSFSIYNNWISIMMYMPLGFLLSKYIKN